MSNVSKEIAIELVEDGQAGNGIVSVTRTYGISASGTTQSDTTSPSDITTWSAGSPTVTTAKPYLWVKEITVYTEIPDTTKYYCVGKRGDNGVDAKDVEWAYIRTTTPTAPTILNDNTYTDSNSKTYTSDGHLPRVDSTNRTDIEKENSGSSSKYYECTDDPNGVDDTWKYEWEIKRTKGNVGSDGSTRTWNYYTGDMTLHNNYAESAFIIDIDNDNDQFGTDSDSKVLVEQTRSTTVTLYDGATPQTLKSLTVALKYENGTTNVPTSVATYTADKDTGKVDVTVKVNNTPNSHTEIQAHITATDTNDRQKTIVFALYKVMGGAPGLTPIIYQVAATNKVFSFARTSSNELTPSSESSNVTQINVARTEGNTTTILDTAQTGLTFSWGFDDDETPQASSQSIGDTIEVSASQATSHGRVWVLLSTGDRETLSIVKDGAKGASGDNGYNTATLFLYKRSATTISSIDWSNTLTYTFSSKSLNSVPVGWSLNTIPSGNDPLYVTAATAYSRTSTDTIASNEWSAPTKFVENGGQGDHGLNSASVFLYQRKSSAPTKPSSTLTYTFATGVLSGTLGDWSQTIPDTDENHLTCWVIQATAVSQGATDTIASTEWSTQKQLVQDGSNGNPGGNTATVFLYSRTKSTIDWTSTLTYTFSTQSLNSIPSGWSLNKIPSGTSPVYVTAATAYSTDETDTITYTEWATPVKFVENGATGGHGINTASLYLYQRAATMPNKPSSTLTYTFATGVLSGTLGSWSQTIPATDSNHYPCWVIQATAIGTGDTDSISSSEWSEQQKLVEDGGQGDNGGNTATIYLYKRSSTAISTVGISSKLYYKFSTKKLYTNSTATTEATTQLNGWSLTIPNNSTNPIYVTAAIAYSNTEVDDIATSEWVTPAKFTENGVEGGHGINTAVVFIYKRASSQPSDKPTGKVTYTFASGDITLESGESWNSWSTTIPSTNGNPCWVRQAIALGNGDTDDIETTDWSDVTKLVADGATGLAGYNTATIFLYSRTNSTITWSNSLIYTFSTKSLSSVPSGWSLNAIPSGTDPIYVTAATATSRESTDSIDANEWATPVLFSENGDAGLNSATVFLYQRASSTPSKPSSSLTYTFSTGVLSGTLGNWSQSIPAVNGNPCWITQATAIATTYTDTIASSEWSTVSKFVEDGTSPYVADIDNEMDAVSVDKFGKIPQLSLTEGSITYAAKVQTTAKLFKGSEPQSFTLKVYDEGGTEYTNNGSYRNGIKVVYTSNSQKSNLIKVYFQSGASVGDKKAFTITLNSTYSVQFTVKGVQGDIYQLLPNTNEVVFGVDGTTNEWTPTTGIDVYCGYTRNVGGTITEYVGTNRANTCKSNASYTEDGTTKYGTAPYNIFFRYQNADSSWGSWSWNKDKTNGTINIPNNTTYVAIQFVLSSATGTGSITEDKIIDKETLPITKAGKTGASGTSPYLADLDNEMGGVACDSDGYTTSEQYIETNAKLFKGTIEQTLKSSGGVVCSIDGYTLYSDYRTSDPSPARTYKAVITGLGTTSANIKVYAKANLLVENVDIKVTLTDTNNVSRDATLTMNGVRGGIDGTPATIYDIVPSLNEVSVGRGTDNSYTPRYNTLQCGYKRSVGSDISTVIEATGNIDSTYRLFFRRHKRATASVAAAWETTYYYYNYSTYKRYLVVTSGYSTSGLDVATYDAVEFLIYKNTSNNSIAVETVEDASNKDKIADKETVSVISDGVAGKNSVRLAIDNEHEDFIYSESGKVAPSGDAESQARLYDGAEQVSASSVGWAFSFDGSDYNGVTTDYIEDALGVAKISSSGLLSVKEIGSDSVSIKVRARYPNNNSGNYYYAEFTANKTQQDKYDIIVTPNAIAYNPSSYSTQTLNISATVTNLQGEQSAATIDTSSTITTGLRVWYAWVNANGSIGSLTSLNAPSLSVESGDFNSHVGVYFELRLYRGGSLPYLVKDHETVEFAKSQNGISPTIYMLDSSVSCITIPSDSSSATLSATVNAFQKEGTASKTAYSGAYLYLFTRTSSSVTVVDSSNSKRSSITISRSVQRTLVSVGVVMLSSYKAASSVVTDINNGAYMAIVEIPVLANGNTGGSGVNAIYLDLDNEMDAILYAGNTKVGSDATTTARLYQGGSPVSSGVTYSISSRAGCDTSTATISSNVVTVSGILSGYTRASVTVKAAYGNGEYYAVFVVDKLIDKPKYEINVDKSVIAVNRDNTSSSSEKIRVRVYKTIANSDGTTTRTNVTSLSTEGIWLWQTDGSHQPEQVYDGTGSSNYKSGGYYDFTASYLRSQASFWLTNTSATYSTLEANMYDMEIVPIVSIYNGEQGIQGKMGRTPYYWGKWSEKTSTDTFTANDYMTPYVANGETGGIPQCWIFVGENGSYTKSTAGEPSSSSTNWQLMTSDFEYLITKAIFSDFAQLGSGIFNGDYVFSQEGTIDGWEANTTKAFANPYTCYYPTSSSIKGRDSVSIKNSLVQVNTTTWTAVSNSFTALRGVPYVISFYFASNPNNYYFAVASSQPSSSTTGWWSSQWNYARPYDWATTDSSVKVWCRKRDSSTSSVRINDIRLTTFVPNLAWNWKTGEIYSQLGHFVNVTVEGVMNNLIQTIDDTNYTKFGVVGGSEIGENSVFWLNPTKIGTVVRYKYSKAIGLPSAFVLKDAGDYTNLCDTTTGTHQMTLDELRQCVGKRIYVLTDENNGMASIKCGQWINSQTEYQMLHTTRDNTWWYSYTSNTAMKNWFWIFECKMATYPQGTNVNENYECIYWELQSSFNKLPDTLG